MHPTFKRHLERINAIPHRWSPGALVQLNASEYNLTLPAHLVGRVRDLGLDHTHAHQSQHTDDCYTPAHLRYTVAWIVNGVVAFHDVHAADELDDAALTATQVLPNIAAYETWQIQLALEATPHGPHRAMLRAELIRRVEPRTL